MENSWQVKCSIPWPSASLSPQFQSQSSRNQIDMTAGQYMHPFAAHETGSIERAIRQEPTAFGPLNLGSVKSGKTELGNSFLALLSGPSHQLHFEYQQLLNSRPVSATNLPIHDSTVVSGPNPGVSGPLISSLTQCHGNESMGNGAASTCSRVALSHDNIQMSGLHFHGSDSTKQSLQHAVHSNGTGMESSSLRWGWLTNTIPSSTKQLHAINFEASPKISQEAKFSIPDLTSSSTRGHPRVFCLNTGGDLLLSDIGRLGVVCLCHNFHMSVANFCEHSGSCAVNPGDVVRLESGETIGQWRKLHFTKFGDAGVIIQSG